jgi:hypothetical protein
MGKLLFNLKNETHTTSNMRRRAMNPFRPFHMLRSRCIAH